MNWRGYKKPKLLGHSLPFQHRTTIQRNHLYPCNIQIRTTSIFQPFRQAMNAEEGRDQLVPKHPCYGTSQFKEIKWIKLRMEGDDKIYQLFPKHGCDTTVRQLMVQIEEMTGTRFEHQRLLYHGKVLNRRDTVDKPLKSFRLEDGSTIRMVERVQDDCYGGRRESMARTRPDRRSRSESDNDDHYRTRRRHRCSRDRDGSVDIKLPFFRFRID